MRAFRIGKDITVRWSILTNGEKKALEGRDLTLFIHLPNRTDIPVDFTNEGNIATFVFRGVNQLYTGPYRLTIWENFGKDGQSVVDCCNAFELVSYTCDEDVGNCNNLKTGILEVSSVLEVGVQGPAGEITDVTATVDNNVGTPSVEVELGGTPEKRTIKFNFSKLKGDIGDPGSSAYELYKEHHPDTELTEEEYAAYPVHAGDAALAAVEKVEQTEERIEAAEKVREEAEQGRILSEQRRVEAESSRAAAEQGRVRAEQGRESAEILRVRAEQERVAAEASRVQGEESRIAAETAREEAEQTRIADEEDRVAAESARAAAEQKRQTDTGEAIGKAAAATKEAEDAAAEATDAAGSIVGPQDVLAHSACSLEERIAHLERLLADILSGEVYIPKLTVRELSVWGDDNLIVTGRGAPSRKPDRAGQFYIDIENDAVYHSVGNAAVSDWKIN